MARGLAVAVLKRRLELGRRAPRPLRRPCRPMRRAACRPACSESCCRTSATLSSMTRKLSQRELRNQSGEIMRELDRGEDFIVTRNGVPVGELRPISRASRSASPLHLRLRTATLVAESGASPARSQDRSTRRVSEKTIDAATDRDLALPRGTGLVLNAALARAPRVGESQLGERSSDVERGLRIARMAVSTLTAGGARHRPALRDDQMPLYTLNASDLRGLEDLVEIVDLG